MEPRNPTPLDDFLFDFRGYVVIKNAVEPALLADLNQVFDDFPDLEFGQWWGNAQRRDYNAATGYELHNCVEAGEPFERLIDHPGWINYVRHYCGEEKSYVEGLFIDECMLPFAGRGGITRCILAASRGRCVAVTSTRTTSSVAASVTLFWR